MVLGRCSVASRFIKVGAINGGCSREILVAKNLIVVSRFRAEKIY